MSQERRERMEAFVSWCDAHITGDEKGEAQTFLDRLFVAYGHAGAKEAGAKFEDRVRRAGRTGTGFADLVWEETALIEMKKRGEPLERHVQQMIDYWVGMAGRRPAYCVLCNFDEFRVFDFDKDVINPVDVVPLTALPDRYDALAFLFPTREEPVFEADHEAVTREAADELAAVFRSLVARGTDRARAQRFALQILVALFAEDIRLLEHNFVLRLIDECDSPARAFDLFDGLFRAMNTPGGVAGGRYKGVQYFNGGLFAESAAVELTAAEVRHLRNAATKNWSKVRPEIFGTIFEHSLDKDDRHAYGAHFTSQLDILKIVKPTITDPWERLIAKANTLKELVALRERLRTVRVLDPACGSGNFLYMAYREMRRLQAMIDTKRSEVSRQRGSKGQLAMTGVSVKQFFGIDVNPFAVELAKVTLMIAKKLATDELHDSEAPLPLDNLDDNFMTADALITFPDDGSDPARTDWPAADVIIGNPPFLGAKRLKPERGPDYVNAVRRLYPEVPGMADYCVYWFRRAHDHLPACTPEDPVAGRAGLVGTQNVRNNKSREGGLDHVAATGVIVEAVDNQPWSGEANVHVSIANWIKTPRPDEAGPERLVPPKRRLWVKAEPRRDDKRPRSRVTTRGKRGVRKDKSYELTYRETAHINAALSDGANVNEAHVLRCVTQPQLSFQGVVPGYDGFVVSREQRRLWGRADPRALAVVKPFLIGRDVLTGDGQASRAVIDFNTMDQLRASAFTAAFAHAREQVMPAVQAKVRESTRAKSDMLAAREEHFARWWQFWNVRSELRQALAPLRRVTVCARVTKRPIFVLCSTEICFDGALQVFAFDDDYSFSLLSSSAHWEWFVANCSKLKSDFRYTRRSVWDTFPWPQSPSNADVLAVAEAGRAVRRIRDEHLPRITGGLRALYRTLELPGKNPLKDAHAALDAAVLKAYGFSPKKDLLAQLLELNLSVAAAEARGEPVTAPGIPAPFAARGGDPASLVTDDCIRPFAL